MGTEATGEAAFRRHAREQMTRLDDARLLDHAHASLRDARVSARARATVAACAGELAARGDARNAAILRSLRYAVMRAPSVAWGARDRHGRDIPVIMHPGYDLVTGRIRHGEPGG